MVDNVSSVKTEPPRVVILQGPRPVRFHMFFQTLVNILREEHGFNVKEGGGKNSKTFSAPGLSSKVSYRVVFTGSGKVMVNIYIERKVRREWNKNKEWNEQLFDKLRERKGDIESKLGESLSWERLDGSDGEEPRMACRIAVYRTGTIDDDPETLGKILEWMIDRLLAFKQVFEPELDRLLK